MRSVRLVAMSVSLVAAMLVATGCGSPPPAARTALAREPNEPLYVRELSGSEQRKVEHTFDELAQGERASVSPRNASGSAGVRWSDVPLAAVYACDEIEAAVVQRTEHDWGWEFRLRTVEDWPGTLSVHHDAAHIFRATATVGWRSERTDRAESLVASFDEHLRAFGKKRRMPE